MIIWVIDPAWSRIRPALEAAEEFDADLLVIGYRRRTTTGKALLGSHASKILLGAKCPVLAIMAPG